MSSPVDPMRTPGRWLVTTASGAIHLIESVAPDGVVTATRVTGGPVGDDPRFPLGSLRRDDESLQVIAIYHVVDGRPVRGFALGEDMYLTLEPLDPAAIETLRRTTPVVGIEELGEGAFDAR
ncbi:hypothetical protein [Cellulomonas sp. NPDC058312]|uniref:hypothetical protein n=1 Tax=Cellulomonas sp. NPDC058312 TaxID=3346441 RepID=UPI0036EC4D9A